MGVVGGDDWKCQLSIKFGPMQEAMLNLRADDPHELDQMVAQMDELVAGSPAGLLSTLQDINQALMPPASGQPDGPTATTMQATPQTTRSCPHGLMEFKSGDGWKGWFCPLPKGNPNKCKPQYER